MNERIKSEQAISYAELVSGSKFNDLCSPNERLKFINNRQSFEAGWKAMEQNIKDWLSKITT